MPRNMSFAMTTEQFQNQSKDVTRRLGWWFLTAGTQLWGVEKAMGLRAGEQVNRLGLIEVISTRAEPLNVISPEDVVREGFPHLSPAQFVELLAGQYKIAPDTLVNRIEYRYLEKVER